MNEHEFELELWGLNSSWRPIFSFLALSGLMKWCPGQDLHSLEASKFLWPRELGGWSSLILLTTYFHSRNWNSGAFRHIDRRAELNKMWVRISQWENGRRKTDQNSLLLGSTEVLVNGRKSNWCIRKSGNSEEDSSPSARASAIVELVIYFISAL